MSNAAQRIEEKVDRLETKIDSLTEALESLMPTEDEQSDEDRIDQIVELLQQITAGQRQNREALDAIDSGIEAMRGRR